MLHYGSDRRRPRAAPARPGDDLARRRDRRRRPRRDPDGGARGDPALGRVRARRVARRSRPRPPPVGVRQPLSNAVSVSQARRLAIFLPIPFAVAGAASLLGRYRLAGCLAAFGAGGLLQLVYPGEFSYFLVVGGPPWPVWLALAGAGIGLIVAAIVRRSAPEAAPLWTAAVALSLVAPVGLAGLAYVKRDEPGPPTTHPGARPRPADDRAGPRHRLLRPRDELPDRGVRARLRLGRTAGARRRHEGQRSERSGATT